MSDSVGLLTHSFAHSLGAKIARSSAYNAIDRASAARLGSFVRFDGPGLGICCFCIVSYGLLVDYLCCKTLVSAIDYNRGDHGESVW